MQQEQIILYLRENIVAVAMWAGGIVLFIWLLILFQVTRTRREVHQICKKIRKYFEVILAEDTQEAPPAGAAAQPGRKLSRPLRTGGDAAADGHGGAFLCQQKRIRGRDVVFSGDRNTEMVYLDGCPACFL